LRQGAAAAGILKRLVDPEVMRVAVHIGDRLAEGDHLVAQRAEEVVVRDVGQAARGVLGRVRGRVAEVVARSLDVQAPTYPVV